jgi:hypothetical protein
MALQFANLSSQDGHFEKYRLNFSMDWEDFHVLQRLRCTHAIFAVIKRGNLSQFCEELGFPKIGGSDFEAS